MLEICPHSEIENELTKIQRKNSIDEFLSFQIQEFAFTFALISLLRKHSLQLPNRSLISNLKKKFLIVEKFRSCIGNMISKIQSSFVKIYIWSSRFVKFIFLLDGNCTILSNFLEKFVCSLLHV